MSGRQRVTWQGDSKITTVPTNIKSTIRKHLYHVPFEKDRMRITGLCSSKRQTMFFPSQTKVINGDMHSLSEEMDRLTLGEYRHVNLQLLRDIVQSSVTPPPFENTFLLCCSSHSSQPHEGPVFALICDFFNVEQNHHQCRLCAIFLRVKGKDSFTYMKTVKFVHSFCNFEKLGEKPKGNRVFTRIMEEMGISTADIKMSAKESANKWNAYLAHNCKSVGHHVANTRGLCFGVNGHIVYHEVRLTQQKKGKLGGIIHHDTHQDKIVFLPALMDLRIKEVVDEYKKSISSLDNTPSRVFETYAEKVQFKLVFQLQHSSRVSCSLMEVDTKSNPKNERFLASVAINFSGEMVYADRYGEGISDVEGLRTIAMRVANKLYDCMTVSFIAQRLRNSSQQTKELLELMTSTDLLCDMEYVILATDVEQGNKPDQGHEIRLATRHELFTGLDHVCSHNLVRERQRKEEEMRESSVMRIDCNQPSLKRPHWMDQLGNVFEKDPLVTQKAMAAKGVAILHLLQYQGGATHKNSAKCFLFPVVGIPRLVDASTISPIQYSPPVSHGDTQVHNPKSPTGEVEPPVERSCRRDHWQHSTGSFSHTYIHGELCYFYHAEDTVPHLMCVFESSLGQNGPRKTNSASSFARGSLVQKLIDLTKFPSPIYTRAMAHMVLVSAVNHCIAKRNSSDADWLKTFKAKSTLHNNPANVMTESRLEPHPIRPYNEPSDFYRALFFDMYEEKNGSLLYEEYSIFSQCLKARGLNHMKSRHNMFTMLLTQAVPFSLT
jgi:hypothetical protein